MKTIWKCELPLLNTYEIPMPTGAKFLSVQVQGGAVQMWWLVDDEVPTKTKRVLRVYGTGHLIRDAHKLTFYGTFQVQGGALVFHLFEEATS